MNIKGLHAHRLQYADNLMERLFAERWDEENRAFQILASLKGSEPTEEEAVTVATVIQWLGSNVGRSFVDIVHQRYERERPKP